MVQRSYDGQRWRSNEDQKMSQLAGIQAGTSLNWPQEDNITAPELDEPVNKMLNVIKATLLVE